MTLNLIASAQLLVVTIACMSSTAATEPRSKDLTLLNSDTAEIMLRPSAEPIARKTPPVVDAFALTPVELRLATERKNDGEETRDANADARRITIELQQETRALQSGMPQPGRLLRFGDASFEKGTTQLNMASRDRLDLLASFLRKHPQQAITITRLAQHARLTDTHRRLSVGRTAAVEHYLVRSGVSEHRLTIAVSQTRDDSGAEGEGPFISVLIE